MSAPLSSLELLRRRMMGGAGEETRLAVRVAASVLELADIVAGVRRRLDALEQQAAAAGDPPPRPRAAGLDHPVGEAQRVHRPENCSCVRLEGLDG